ncbi:MAG: 4-hydroxythreonine-4-phosphate dehydrogenase PdxA [Bacteroidales bacterium]|nr:4-hydroxythreonine-4-phosphate dehydrogenase PdxA [Candidatus Sodaliphilus aphodohippi]
MAKERKIRVGITQGDTNGIGYEVILKTLSCPEFCELCTPVVYGSSKIMAYHRKALKIQQFNVHIVGTDKPFNDNAVNLVEVGDPKAEIKVELGQPDKQAGAAAFQALEAAVSDLKSGRIDVMVTAPINKETIQSDEFKFPGHTEYLETCLGEEGDKALMVLCNDSLRVALVTTHLPIAQVAPAITEDNIRKKLRLFNKSLKRDFGIGRPRIAVLALNPHSGENGLLGNEEKDVIAPAIQKSYDDEHLLCFGPFAADGFFGSESYRHFDGVLAMYHDQGLTAFKALSMDNGVNFTAGLPYVRTSPDHGTGYDIAGQNVANENSLRQAIYTAIDICRNRERHDEANANPLKKMYFDRGKDNVVLDLTKDA